MTKEGRKEVGEGRKLRMEGWKKGRKEERKESEE